MSRTCPVSCGLCSPTCPPLNIVSGSVRPQGHIQPDFFVSVVCEVGYKYSESLDFLRCLPTGRYDRRVGQCRKNHCEKPYIPHGRLSSSDLIMSGHWTSVICDQGFKHSHSGSQLYCRPDSLTLEGTVGFCQAETFDCPEMVVAFGEVHPRGVVPSNSWAQIKCFEGFSYSESSPFILCNSDGKYAGIIGHCIRSEPVRRCRIPHIDNGTSNKQAHTLLGETLRIICRAGYVYSLPSPTHSCTYHGIFDPAIGVCNPIPRCSVPVIVNGQVDTSGVVSAGAWVKVSCKPNFTYTLSETSHFCDRNGELVPRLGECLKLFQGRPSCPSIKMAGSPSLPATPIGQWVQVQCYPGYQYSLNRDIHICLNSQEYTPPIGSCVVEESNRSSERSITYCPTPVIANSVIPASPVQVNTWVRVECVPGYSYSRNNYLHYCQEDGSYNLEFGECIEDKPLGRCSKISISNGVIRPNSDVVMGSMVEVICDDGYSYSRTTAVHFCGIDLQFEPVLGECTRIRCPELDVKNAIIVPTTKPSAFEKIFVICLTGHVYIGESPTFTCLSNGSYDGVIGSCQNRDDPNKSLDQELIEVGFLTKAVVQIVTQENNFENHDSEISNEISDSESQFHAGTVDQKVNQTRSDQGMFTNALTTGPISQITERDSVSVDNRILTEAPTSELLYSTPDYGNDPSLVTPNIETQEESNQQSTPSSSEGTGENFQTSYRGTDIPNQVVTSEPDGISNEIPDREETASDSRVGWNNITCSPATVEHGALDTAGDVPVSTEVRVMCDEGYLYSKTTNVIKCGRDGGFVPDIGSCMPRGEFHIESHLFWYFPSKSNNYPELMKHSKIKMFLLLKMCCNSSKEIFTLM